MEVALHPEEVFHLFDCYSVPIIGQWYNRQDVSYFEGLYPFALNSIGIFCLEKGSSSKKEGCKEDKGGGYHHL